jgi:hypothetical protein
MNPDTIGKADRFGVVPKGDLYLVSRRNFPIDKMDEVPLGAGAKIAGGDMEQPPTATQVRSGVDVRADQETATGA